MHYYYNQYSISPASGDAVLTGTVIHEETTDLADGRPLDTGLVKVLEGSDKFFVILVADYGFAFVPRNAPKKNYSKY